MFYNIWHSAIALRKHETVSEMKVRKLSKYYMCMYVCMYVGMYVCMYVGMYVGMYVRLYACMY